MRGRGTGSIARRLRVHRGQRPQPADPTRHPAARRHPRNQLRHEQSAVYGARSTGKLGVAVTRARCVGFDGFTLLVVKGDVPDPGVQPDPVVFQANPVELGDQDARVEDLLLGAATRLVAEQALDPRLIGWGAGATEPGHTGQELAGRVAAHLRPVVADGKKQRDVPVVSQGVHPVPVFAAQRGRAAPRWPAGRPTRAALRPQARRGRRLDLGAGLLRRGERAQPVAGHHTIEATPARVQCVKSTPIHGWVPTPASPAALPQPAARQGQGLPRPLPGARSHSDTWTRSRRKPWWASLRCDRFHLTPRLEQGRTVQQPCSGCPPGGRSSRRSLPTPDSRVVTGRSSPSN